MHYLLHGTGCTPESHWFPRLRDLLEKQGHTVLTPALPNAVKPNRQEWRDFVVQEHTFSDDTIIIGHSAGATAILSILEVIEKPIKKAILVSGFYVPLEKAGRAKLMLQDSYNRGKIQARAGEIIFINSDNDPWGCDDTQARPVAEKLGAQFVLATGMGHMGSDTFDDPCPTLPLLLDYC